MDSTFLDQTLGHLLSLVAKEWEGAPYVHQASKRFGCDCSGLITGTLEELGYDMSSIDLPDRPSRLFDDRLLWQTEKIATSKGRDPATAEPGDLILFKLGGYVQHISIKIEEGLMIHADRHVGKVVVVGFSDDWISRIHAIYGMNWSTLPKRAPQL